MPWSLSMSGWMTNWNRHCNLCPLKVTQLPFTSLPRGFSLAPPFPPLLAHELPANISLQSPPVSSPVLGPRIVCSFAEAAPFIEFVNLSSFFPVLSKKPFLIYLAHPQGRATTVNPTNFCTTFLGGCFFNLPPNIM